MWSFFILSFQVTNYTTGSATTKTIIHGTLSSNMGEAANLRFMPECLCYIYHHLAYELYGMLAGKVSPTTGENVKPAYGGEEEAFLRKVVTSIYDIIAQEAQRSGKGKETHSQWRNYDDLNEYFWSADCFRLGWPMCADAGFFCKPLEQSRFDKNGDNKPSTDRWVGKVDEGPYDEAVLSAYRYIENVRNLLVVVQEMGIPNFEASDLEHYIEQEAVKKMRCATKKPYSRSIVGAILEVIQKKRAEKPEVRDIAREVALRELKERIKKTKDEKKAKKAEVTAESQRSGKGREKNIGEYLKQVQDDQEDTLCKQ